MVIIKVFHWPDSCQTNANIEKGLKMNFLEILGVFFIVTVLANVLVGIFAMKNALPETVNVDLFEESDLDSLTIGKAY